MMKPVRPKKFLGQHFLKDDLIAKQIVDALTFHNGYQNVLEVGPGMGVLTRHFQNKQALLKAVEIDEESVAYLLQNNLIEQEQIVKADFLQMDLQALYTKPFGLIGNFPYNISSQIFFKVLENIHLVAEVVGMLQKEVAERICAPPGSRTYGILSVLLQAFYEVEYLFTVDASVFVPPPKVQSGVIRLKRNQVDQLPCDFLLFKKTVKLAFLTRRKTLRNALKSLNLGPEITMLAMFDLRAEQLSVKDFIRLTGLIYPNLSNVD